MDLHSTNINLHIPVSFCLLKILYDAPEWRYRGANLAQLIIIIQLAAKRLEIATSDLHNADIKSYIPDRLRPMKSLYDAPELSWKNWRIIPLSQLGPIKGTSPSTWLVKFWNLTQKAFEDMLVKELEIIQKFPGSASFFTRFH